jgi:hypothetical protein
MNVLGYRNRGGAGWSQRDKKINNLISLTFNSRECQPLTPQTRIKLRMKSYTWQVINLRRDISRPTHLQCSEYPATPFRTDILCTDFITAACSCYYPIMHTLFCGCLRTICSFRAKWKPRNVVKSVSMCSLCCYRKCVTNRRMWYTLPQPGKTCTSMACGGNWGRGGGRRWLLNADIHVRLCNPAFSIFSLKKYHNLYSELFSEKETSITLNVTSELLLNINIFIGAKMAGRIFTLRYI